MQAQARLQPLYQDGDRADTPLFEVQVNPLTGEYTVTLLDNVLHESLDGEEGDNTENDATATLTYTVFDSDGDAANGTLEVTFDDDIPEAWEYEPEGPFDDSNYTMMGPAISDTVTVEDEKMDGGIDEDDGGVDSVGGTIVDNVNWGADGFGSTVGFSVGGEDFAAGATVYWGQDGTFLGTDDTAAAASLLVNIDGTYTYTLLDNVLLGQDVPGRADECA